MFGAGWALLLCTTWTIAQAQTAYFSGAQTTLGSGFKIPIALAIDSARDLFVADDENNAVKEIVAVNGSIPVSPTILTLGSGFNQPQCVAVDASGNVYVCDTGNNAVKEMVAVNGSIPASPTIRTLTSIEYPYGVAVDSSGDVFVAGGCPAGSGQGSTDCGFVEELLAVNGVVPSSPNADTWEGSFDNPAGLAIDTKGDVFVADEFNHAIKEIVAIDGGVSLSSTINTVLTFSSSVDPTGVAIDGSGNVYAALLTADLVDEALAVNGSIPASPTILSLGSGLSYPSGVALDSSGNVYIADAFNNRVLMESLSGASFGALNIGTKSPAVTLNFSFGTGGTLGSVAVLTAGESGQDFANTGNGSCKANTAYVAGQTCTLIVTCTPSLAGTRVGSAILYGNAGIAIATGALQGEGIGPAATPAISPAAGTYTTAQTVTITDSTPGATIYYTTDGTTPTTSSTVYSASILVAATQTIEAIAAGSGSTPSAVDTAAYTIQPANTGPSPVPLFATGSSSFYLEAGEASYANQGCSWTTSSRLFALADSRLNLTDTADAWITWQPTTGNCATPIANSEAIYLDTDSVVGVRCFFAVPRCTISSTVAAGSPGANLLGNPDTPLPAAILSAISGATINVAATEIRPEDAKFATLRALTPCGNPVVPGSQYLGLSYTGGSVISGSTHQTGGAGGGFNVADFNLIGSDPYTGIALSGNFTATAVGAAPVLVVVNPQSEVGFGSLLVFNIDRAILAGYLDGTYGSTAALIPQIYEPSEGNGSTIYLPEFLSGTYNTMEYSIANSVQNQSSQDVGLAALNAATQTGNTFPPFYCNDGVPGGLWLSTQNPLNESVARPSGATSGRYRALGTAAELAAIQSTADSLGYASWSVESFANATAQNTKYLTVDGIDPIQQTWTGGLIPTGANDLLGSVTLAHVKDGTYPIWSILRLISDPQGSGYTAAATLAQQTTTFVSPAQPNFVPISQLQVLHSHFAPPGVNFVGAIGNNTASNGTSSAIEAGGDVGGLVYTVQADGSYNADNSVRTGNTGHRQ